MIRMTVKLLVEGDEKYAYDFNVHPQWESHVKVMVKNKLEELAHDFDIQKTNGSETDG